MQKSLKVKTLLIISTNVRTVRGRPLRGEGGAGPPRGLRQPTADRGHPRASRDGPPLVMVIVIMVIMVIVIVIMLIVIVNRHSHS